MDLHADPPNSGTKKRKQNEQQDALVGDHGNSMSVGESSGSDDLCESLTSISLSSKNSNGSNSDISCHDVDKDVIDDDEDALEDPDDGYDFYDDDDIYEDDYSLMQDQLDNVDFPPGVEASLTLLKDIASGKCKPAVVHVHSESSSKENVDESTDNLMQNFWDCDFHVHSESSSKENVDESTDNLMQNFWDCDFFTN